MIDFPASFCIMFLSDGIATSISKQVQSLLLILMSGLFARICVCVSVCTPWFHHTVLSSCSHTEIGMCEYQFSVSVPNSLH